MTKLDNFLLFVSLLTIGLGAAFVGAGYGYGGFLILAGAVVFTSVLQWVFDRCSK